MRRTTIMADEAVMTELEYLAREDGVPTSRLVREALDRYVTERTKSRRRRLPAFVGMFRGSGEEIASRATEILREELPQAAWADQDDPPPWGRDLGERRR